MTNHSLESLPLRKINDVIDSCGVLEQEPVSIDVGMPYHGHIMAGYVILGGEEDYDRNQLPALRASLVSESVGIKAVSLTVKDFYAKTAESSSNIHAVGMPQHKQGEKLYELKDAPNRVKQFGALIDLENQVIGVHAISERDDAFNRKYDAYGIESRVARAKQEVDYAYKLGMVLSIALQRKLS